MNISKLFNDSPLNPIDGASGWDIKPKFNNFKILPYCHVEVRFQTQ